MTIKLLTLDDLQAITVLTEKPTIGVSEDQHLSFLNVEQANLKDLLNVGLKAGAVFGYFSDSVGEEATLLGYLVTCVSENQPCYFVRKARTKTGAPLNVLSDLFYAAIKQHEQWGYKRFYCLYRQSDIATYRRLWRMNTLANTYLAYSDLVVPPDLRPKHADFWDLLFGRSLYTETMVVRGFIRLDDTAQSNQDALTIPG